MGPLLFTWSVVSQLCLTLHYLMDCSPPSSSVHGILRARIVEWVAIPFSTGSSQPRDRTWVSLTAGRSFIVWAKTTHIPINKTKLHQFSSVPKSCSTLCNPMDCSKSGFPVHHQLPVLAQTHVRWVSDAIQPSHPLSSPSPPAFNLSQHQGLYKWVSSLHQVARVLEIQLQHQSLQWIFRTDLL